MKVYYAHSAENADRSKWQTLRSHAVQVAEAAGGFARFFHAREIAYATGLLHDLGKYSPQFAARLEGSSKPADHSTAGAKIAAERWGKLGKLMAYCIAGHHTGLANGAKSDGSRTPLNERLKYSFGSDIPALDDVWRQEISLPEKLPSPPLRPHRHYPAFSHYFFTRMLYSCLVDADFLDTEAFYAAVQRGGAPELGSLKPAFDQHLHTLRQQAAAETDAGRQQVNRLRAEVLEHAVAQAVLPPGLFTLTVPTGGGKTLTSMAFALEHALRHGMRRIIYVIPFTSIIEQNADVFRKAFGSLGEEAVLEHHSNFDDDAIREKHTRDKLRLASENWDRPVVVSTAVQFFESLFADRSARSRKLHNISGSVIILDEAQILPLKLLRPIMAAIDELARNYGCSVVLCTATQPAVGVGQGFYNGLENLRELAPNPPDLFRQLRRTRVSHIGLQTDVQLREKLAEHQQILIIVNNRRHARSLYEQAADMDGVFHLTTLMCAQHRAQVLAHIRARLPQGLPCRVVATSLVEAGVDFDFPVVMRAETGLDSVAQAAGRCNREGKKLPENSLVWVFAAESQWKTPPELRLQAACMQNIVGRYQGDLLAPEAMQEYFSMLYQLKGDDLDKEQILADIVYSADLNFPFQDIARKFRMIDSVMLPLIIPFDEVAKQAIKTLRYADKVGGSLRQLQRYTVQIPQKPLQLLYAAGRVELINRECFGEQFYVLSGMDLYDSQAGLSWENQYFVEAENLVV